MRRTKRLANIAASAVVAFSSILGAGLVPLVHAAAQTCTWIGGTDTNFSTAANWSNCGSGAPQAGDTIEFNGQLASSSTVNLTNDLGVALGGVIAAQVANSDGGSNYYYGTYHIDTLSLADGATVTSDAACSGTTHAEYLSFGAVSSTGSITDNLGYTGSATLTIGANYSTVAGGINAGSGSTVTGNVTILSPLSVQYVCGGMGGGLASGSSLTGFTINGLIVQNGAYVTLASSSFPITLGGGTGTTSPHVGYYGDVDSNNNYTDTTYTVSSPITLLHDAVFTVGEKATVNVTGSISGASYAITRDPTSDATGVLNIQSSNNSSNTQNGSLVNAEKTTTVTDSQTGLELQVVDKETAVLDGDRGFVDVLSGGTLKGTGTGTDIVVNKNATIAPGHSPGKLTATSSLNLVGGSTYQAELKDSADGDYDQIVVGDSSITTGHAVTLGDSTSSPTLDVQLYTGYSIKAGDKFTIIDNKSGTDVSGTFANLPEGATFKGPNGSVFSITYKGGDGNDVVLTAVTAPTTPDTGFGLAAAHPAVTLGVTVLAAGAIFGLAQKNRKLSVRR